MRWFRHVERRNSEGIFKKVGEIRVERNERERRSPKRKRKRRGREKVDMGVLGSDMRAREVDEDG